MTSFYADANLKILDELTTGPGQWAYYLGTRDPACYHVCLNSHGNGFRCVSKERLYDTKPITKVTSTNTIYTTSRMLQAERSLSGRFRRTVLKCCYLPKTYPKA